MFYRLVAILMETHFTTPIGDSPLTGIAAIVSLSDIVSVEDNCSDNVTIQSVPETGLLGCDAIGENLFQVTVSDGSNTLTCNSLVTIVDVTPPTGDCVSPAVIQVDANGDADLKISDFAINVSDNCDAIDLNAVVASFNCNNPPQGEIFALVSDASGNSFGCQVAVQLQDNIPPQAVCQDILIVLDALGNASIGLDALDGGSTDNCGINSFAIIGSTDFTCTDLGENPRQMIAFDNAFNQDICDAVVTVVDQNAPLGDCNVSTTIELSPLGLATVVIADVTNNVSDNCNVDLTQVVADLDCSDVGTQVLDVGVFDQNGNAFFCDAEINVVDVTPPSAFCQDVTLALDATGNISVAPGDVNNGSLDACGIESLVVFGDFNCSNIGNGNQVELTVTDINGNESSCFANVTIIDNIAPNAICQNVTLNLDNTGNAFLNANQLDGGSTDNCGGLLFSTSAQIFTCDNIGSNLVTLEVLDDSGNLSTCNSTVTVIDAIPPSANCVNFSAILNVNGNASVTPQQLIINALDNCGPISFTANPTNFTCADLVPNPVLVNLQDPSGNVFTCTAIVTVVDNLAPNTLCQNATVQLDANGNGSITVAQIDAGTTDNCDLASLQLDQNNFTCTDVGQNNVTLTATDAAGNVSTCIAAVTIQDNLPPTALCQTATVQLDANGTATVAAADIDNGSSDNCGIQSLQLNQSVFACAEVGPNGISLIVTDINNNINTCNATIFVEDNLPPTAFCQDLSVELDANGQAAITPQQVNFGSFDNCGIDNLILDIQNFDCTNLNNNTVTLTVTDVNGNVAFCNANIFVEDNFNPIIQECATTISVANDLGICGKNNPSLGQPLVTDNCSIASIVNDAPVFFPVGISIVNWTITDQFGNFSVCQQTVEILDNELPELTCPVGQIVITDQNFCEFINLNNINEPVVIDNCGIADLVNDAPDLIPVGIHPITWAATDIHGNQNVCTFDLTVTDPFPPVSFNCPNSIVLEADPNTCQATANFNEPDFIDNCEVAFIQQNVNIGDLLPIGNTIVEYRAFDIFGNDNICVFDITVVDNVLPTIANCPDDIERLLADETDTATAFWDIPTFMENCDSEIQFSHNPGDAFPIGITEVIYSIFDGQGEGGICQFSIEVLDPVVFNCNDDLEISIQNTDEDLSNIAWNFPYVTGTDCEFCDTITIIDEFKFIGIFEGHRYYISEENALYFDAMLTCESLNGHLAVINSEKENEFLTERMEATSVFIGLNDDIEEGSFEWVNGDSITFTNFFSNPILNEDNRDFVRLLNNGQWDVDFNGSSRRFILEIPCFDFEMIEGSLPNELESITNQEVSYAYHSLCGISDTCEFNLNFTIDNTLECNIEGNTLDSNFIQRVAFDQFNFNSGDNEGYGSFLFISALISSNESIPLVVEPAKLDKKHYLRVWFDWNFDNDFFDESELMVELEGEGEFITNVNIPSFVTQGVTRMRVALSTYDFVEPCGGYAFGEVEDYGILVTASNSSNNPNNLIFNDLGDDFAERIGQPFPNPTSGKATMPINLTTSTNLQIDWYDVSGRQIKTQEWDLVKGKHKLKLPNENLKPGIYYLKIKTTKSVVSRKLILTELNTP